jgi:hypothetical protein
MVVQSGSSLVKAASVPRIRKSESFKVQVVTEFMAQRTQECAEGGDFLPHGCPHPYADQHSLRIVVAEKFGCRVLANLQRSGSEYSNAALRYFVEL